MTRCEFLSGSEKGQFRLTHSCFRKGAPDTPSLYISPIASDKVSTRHRLSEQSQGALFRRTPLPGVTHLGCPPSRLSPPGSPQAGGRIQSSNAGGDSTSEAPDPEGTTSSTGDAQNGGETTVRATGETPTGGAQEEHDGSTGVTGEAPTGASEGPQNGSAGVSGRQETRRGGRKGRRPDPWDVGADDEDSEEEGGAISQLPAPPPPKKKPGGYRDEVMNVRGMTSKKGKKKKEKVPSLDQAEELFRASRRGKGERPARGGEPNPATSTAPGGKKMVGGTSRKGALEAELERTEKDQQLHGAVSKILMYSKDERSQKFVMTDQLMDYMVDLLDKYNAYVDCDYDPPWAGAIERLVEAFGDMEDIHTHLTDFTKEVSPQTPFHCVFVLSGHKK